MLLRKSTLLMVLSVLAGTASARPNASTCALSDQHFATAINTLRDWIKIHAFYKAHVPPCPEDGMFAEGYSELVVRTLATNWSNLAELRVATSQDPSFKAFVLRHIDATTSEADLRLIRTSATSKCPKDSGSLCAEIRRASATALRELK
ncbi:hypothetical protein [Paucibacter sp. Y2R2-4]|uniref:hypothetical protein n=1 Tax=Paucibacter sp. Y2R2-4 TaxID=2893553 RepID=UPI0021E50D75|nr:hypothetical protein [Paucibacter sp. Y2R2-4]MCV2350655.1 hypothetical protein [Paucibacter sp. Y2R2-4]